MRLQKYLASCGVASRRNAEQMILDGRVSVNGEKVTDPFAKFTKADFESEFVLKKGKKKFDIRRIYKL